MEKIEKVVKSLLDETCYNLDAVCKNQNVNIIETDIETEGLCLTCFNSKFIIINNNLTDLSRDFVIAHELGHITLHNNELIYLKENAFFSKSKLENEANRFSVKILSIINKEYKIENEKDLEIMEEINEISNW